MTGFGVSMLGGILVLTTFLVNTPACAQAAQGSRCTHMAEDWQCDAETLNGAKCALPSQFRLDAAWQNATSEADAIEVVRNQYQVMANAVDFSVWLDCQGFEIYAMPSQRISGGLFVMAAFNRNVLRPFPLSFFDFYGWIGLKNSQAFHIELDRSGKISTITVHEVY